MKKLRITYFLLFFVLLLTEVLIALFVRDRFVRPYIGDVLVTMLICSFIRIFFPNKLSLLSVYVFAFAALVEIGQYFRLVKILGLEQSTFFRTVLGTTFSLADLICYAAGCALFFGIDHFLHKQKST